jgi:hypothetical protein
VISVEENASAPNITSSIWRRTLVGTAVLADAESASNPRSYRWVRRRSRPFGDASRVEPEGYQLAN